MWKTRLLLGASLFALAASSSISTNAGFDRRVNGNTGVGSGAYSNPYLPGQSQPQPGQTVTAQPGGGFGWGPGPWGFGFGGEPFLNLPRQSQPQPSQTGIAQPGGGFGFTPTPWGGYGLMPTPGGIFNLPGQSQPQPSQIGIAQPAGGFGFTPTPWGGYGIIPTADGMFNLPGQHQSFTLGGWGLPGESPPFIGNWPAGFNLGPVSGSSPWGGFAIGGHISALPWGELGFGQQRDAPAWHGFNLGPVSASWPGGGFGFNPQYSFGISAPGGSAHASAPGGFGFIVPGFNLGPVGASSPGGGFGFNPHASAPGGFNLIGPGWNLGQAPQPNMMQPAYSPYGCAPSGYPQQTGAPGQPAAPSGANRTALTQPVSCSINEISLLSRNVSDCEKAGGTVLAANAQQ